MQCLSFFALIVLTAFPSSTALLRCLPPANWPSFESAQELAASPWGTYITNVYGEIPQDATLYPWCMGDQWMFYDTLLNASNVTDIPPIPAICPMINTTLNVTDAPEGQRYAQNNPFSPEHLSWSWHPSNQTNPLLPWTPFANATWVEVMHRLYASDEKTGAWFYFAKGSGIWLNIGKTIDFEAHANAYTFFNVTDNMATGGLCAGLVNITTPNECMCYLAAAQGYDTIQFMKSAPQICPYSKTPSVQANMNYELVSTHLQGEYACTSPDGLSPLIRTGWLGSRQCTCNATSSPTQNLNCAEVPV